MKLNPRKTDDINYNKKLILNCVRQFEPISRAEIYKKLQISKPTVSSIAEELIKEGWVYESVIARKHTKSGRKPTYLRFNEKAFYVLGVDIGGTNVLIAISDLNGNIICEKHFDTAAYLENGFLKQLRRVVFEMLSTCKVAKKPYFGDGGRGTRNNR
ncbi:MarR family transcriptional regulator [Virgibacillus halophilus]|uniref:MarR family transcriptional regulator n=1 Tax=Tigheibacillus halophilus TaxID=361280 RepID=A0ABU5C241_9BACI|nr:MarR family transcriptional regulator [Virgibacillus halophilus]